MLLANDVRGLAVASLALLGVLATFFVIPAIIAWTVCAKAWFRAYLAGLDLPLRITRLPPQIAVRCIESLILAHERCLDDSDLTFGSLQAHCEAGGDVLQVVRAMVEADRRGIPLSFREATKIDLSEKSLVQFVESQDRLP